MFEFIPKEKIRYPWMCISKYDDKIVLTTKKIGSRFFEDITKQPGTHKFNSIDVRFEWVNLEYDTEVNRNYLINDISVSNVGSRHTLSFDEFFNNFNIQSFKQFFSEEYFQNNKIFIIVRNPYDRFYTGFFENVDHWAYNEHSYENLKNLPQETIESILNKYIEKIDYTHLSDSHLSLWNTFIYKILIENNLQNYVNVIDLNNTTLMNSTFGYLEQPTNKPYLEKWLNNVDNKKYIEPTQIKLGYYFDLEMKYYNKLLHLNK